jgi:hypothetical protein
MPLPLSSRLGQIDDDFVSTFEAAASRNFIDATALRRSKRSMAAIYLYGYSVEMRVKAAYFRMVFAAHQPPLPPGATRIDVAMRRAATQERDSQGNFLVSSIGPHSISGRAALLKLKRALLASANQAVAYTPALATEVRNRADRVYDHWKEYMRYRAIAVRAGELATVRGDADWFRRRYQNL